MLHQRLLRLELRGIGINGKATWNKPKGAEKCQDHHYNRLRTLRGQQGQVPYNSIHNKTFLISNIIEVRIKGKAMWKITQRPQKAPKPSF
jgi:hypothetical protein